MIQEGVHGYGRLKRKGSGGENSTDGERVNEGRRGEDSVGV